jgi:hypothetical protein
MQIEFFGDEPHARSARHRIVGFRQRRRQRHNAAELPFAHPGIYSAGDFESGRHGAMLWTYDNQPGVVVRAYWSAPWRHHHYFPATDTPPDIGRDEDLSASGEPPKPAKTFRRSWSNVSAFEHERRVHMPMRDEHPMPRKGPPPSDPELK